MCGRKLLILYEQRSHKRTAFPIWLKADFVLLVQETLCWCRIITCSWNVTWKVLLRTVSTSKHPLGGFFRDSLSAKRFAFSLTALLVPSPLLPHSHHRELGNCKVPLCFPAHFAAHTAFPRPCHHASQTVRAWVHGSCWCSLPNSSV